MLPFEQQLDRLPSISLDELVENAALMRRYDNKYVTSNQGLQRFAESLGPHWRVLRVNGIISPSYRSTYFDDARRTSYRDHVQDRRPRFKVRSRTYDDGTSFLEVKLKTGRGQTDKLRILRVPNSPTDLTEPERLWLSSILVNVDSRNLHKGLTVDFQRITLHSYFRMERITIDHSMAVTFGDRKTSLLAEGGVVEVKSSSFNSPTGNELARLDIRPASFSKYCAGLSMFDETIHPRIRIAAERALSRN